MINGLPDSAAEDQALAAFGLQRKREAPAAFELWPENLSSVMVFDNLMTQWSIALNGKAIGLKYEAIGPVLHMVGVKREDWPAVFQDLRKMERVALDIFNNR